MRTCNTCLESKEIQKHYSTKGSLMCKQCKNKRDYTRRNKDKIKENSDRYRLKKGHSPRVPVKDSLKKIDPLYNKNMNLISRYGVSLIDYDKMMEAQNSCCAICFLHIKKYNKQYFSVDHCHDTGKVRGLLCGKCNTGLGMFRDNLDIVENALKYLKN